MITLPIRSTCTLSGVVEVSAIWLFTFSLYMAFYVVGYVISRVRTDHFCRSSFSYFVLGYFPCLLVFCFHHSSIDCPWCVSFPALRCSYDYSGPLVGDTRPPSCFF